MARRNAKRKLSKKEQKALTKQRAGEATGDATQTVPEKRRSVVTVALPPTVTIATLAGQIGRSASEIVGLLMQNGVIATINDSVDRETVEIIAEPLDIIVTPEQTIQEASAADDGVTEVPRPPVVVVLGHVDHGKTTLLDSIRQANVVAGESGGITQHIGAYQVEVREGGRKITFIDTPGHEAFSAMRAHGVTMTDIAILVVAADDGVRPQTKEAVSHARAAGVPIIIAINKIDVPGAQIDRVKGELAELDLAAEDWGGKTPTVLISAKQKTGLDELLETVLLVADLAELTARPTGRAEGVVIEAHMEQGIGPVATILVLHGELKVSDPVVIGSVYGKVRIMEDADRRRYQVAGPATPVRIAGLTAVPSFGDTLIVVTSEKRGKELASLQSLAPGDATVSLTEPTESDRPPELAVVVKADVDGSLAAIKSSLEGLATDAVAVRIIHEGVGDLSESDVNLAIASQHPFLVAFRTGATVAARMLARTKQLEIHAYDVIYRLIDDATTAAAALIKPQTRSVEIGRLKILQIFHTTKTAQIVGGRVEQGEVRDGGSIQIIRTGEAVGTGTIETLQRGQQKAKKVATGEECGLGVATTETIEVGDVLIVAVDETSASN